MSQRHSTPTVRSPTFCEPWAREMDYLIRLGSQPKISKCFQGFFPNLQIYPLKTNSNKVLGQK